MDLKILERDLSIKENQLNRLNKKQEELWEEMKIYSLSNDTCDLSEYYMSSDPDRRDLTVNEFEELYSNKLDSIQKQMHILTEEIQLLKDEIAELK